MRIIWKFPPFRTLLGSVLMVGVLFILFADIPRVEVVEKDASLVRSDLLPPDTLEQRVKEDKEEVREPLVQSALLAGNKEPHVQQDWIPALGSPTKLFIYSAYHDRRQPSKPLTRIVAIVKKKTKYMECIYWTNSKKSHSVIGHVQMLRENWNLAYTGAFVKCPLPETEYGDTITRVSVTTDKAVAGTFEDSIPIISLDDRHKIGEMSVCVKPFHYEFNRAVWLVEFIEFYKILGASKFIFYNHTVGPDVDRVLRYYTQEGSVEVHPWTLPVQSQKEIRTEGIFASLNDCNLRSVGHYPLSAMVDVDEFIIPRYHDNLLNLVHEQGDYNAYIFKNVFFYLYWENDTALHDTLSSPVEEGAKLFGGQGVYPYLLTQTKTRRLVKAHPYGTRSKYLTRPERTAQVGNHVVWEYVDGSGTSTKSKNVADSIAVTHHYRICEFGGFDCLKSDNMIDKTAHRFMEPLLLRVSEACGQIFPEEPACPVAPPLGSPW